MLGQPNYKEDEDSLKKRLTSTQALASMNPNQAVRMRNDGYTFEGSASDALKFGANSVSRNDPVAQKNRDIQRQQWEARQPVRRVVSSGQSPTPIAPPKTMGDMLRYNRESKAQRIAADQANARAKTGIDAFSAQQSALNNERTALNNARATDIDAQRASALSRHYDNTNNVALKSLKESTADRKARQALEASKTPSEIALREAQARGATEQALTTEQEREAARATNDLKQEEITQRYRIANDPNATPEERYNALAGNINKPISEAQQGALQQKEFDTYVRFMSAFPPARREEGERAYLEYKKKFGGDLSKMQALIANNPEMQDEEDDQAYIDNLFN